MLRDTRRLIESHGTITLGTDLEQAYQRTELLEDFAKFVLVSKILAGAH
jgi:ribulose-5-phosphate 4-epimerase/fuculose-1-phosphate aldolase